MTVRLLINLSNEVSVYITIFFMDSNIKIYLVLSYKSLLTTLYVESLEVTDSQVVRTGVLVT